MHNYIIIFIIFTAKERLFKTLIGKLYDSIVDSFTKETEKEEENPLEESMEGIHNGTITGAVDSEEIDAGAVEWIGSRDPVSFWLG